MPHRTPAINTKYKLIINYRTKFTYGYSSLTNFAFTL